MKNLLKYLFAIIVSVVTLSSCNNQEVPADAPEAKVQGNADAKALLKLSTGETRELHSAMLAVKAREWEMRRNGDDTAADAYIQAFRDYVAGHDKKLADEIF